MHGFSFQASGKEERIEDITNLLEYITVFFYRGGKVMRLSLSTYER